MFEENNSHPFYYDGVRFIIVTHINQSARWQWIAWICVGLEDLRPAIKRLTEIPDWSRRIRSIEPFYIAQDHRNEYRLQVRCLRNNLILTRRPEGTLCDGGIPRARCVCRLSL